MFVYQSKKLKIWALLCHFFIIVGFGHDILCMGVLEIAWFPYFNHDISFKLTAPFENRLPAVGFITLLGQTGIVASWWLPKRIIKTCCYLAGIALLWLSIFYYCSGIEPDGNRGFLGFTAVPFAVATLLIFLRNPVIKLYNWVQE